MNKILLVAWREFYFNLRRRAFLFAAFGAPLITVALMLVVFNVAVGGHSDPESLGRIGYVDRAGVLAQALEQPDYFVSYATEEEAAAALEAGEIGGYFVVRRNYLAVGAVHFYAPRAMPAALRREIDTFLVTNLLTQTQDLQFPTERLLDPFDMTIITLDSGRELTSAGTAGLFLVPFIFVFVFLMASQVSSGFLMSGVVEEKSTRIMEILVTSVTPLQMLVGKVLGLGALGLLQFIVWVGGGFLIVTLGDQANLEFLQGVVIPLDVTVLGLLYFVLSYLLLGTLMAGIGAVANTEEESRQWSGIFSLLAIIPFFFITQFLENSGSALPVILSLIPFTAGPSMLLRVAFASVPLGEIVLSLGLLLLSSVLVAWASARIFRWALLMYGKRPTPRELWRVIRSAPQESATTIAQSEPVEALGR